MKKTIDHLTSISGWAVNAPSTISVNDHDEYIAGFNDTSLLIKFDSADVAKTAIKTFTAIDVTDYNTLVFSLWSQNKGRQDYIKAGDFSYKIKINDTSEFYLQIFDTFTNVNIAIDDIDSINRIEITAIHSDDDFIIISEMIVEKEELPLDVLLGTKEHLLDLISTNVGKGILVATLTGSAGDKELTFTGDRFFLEHYGVILIDDGVNSETHQLDDGDGTTFSMKSTHDGRVLLNSHTDADVYITFPIDVNPDENDIKLPGITLWGIDPEAHNLTGKSDVIIQSFSVDNDNFVIQREGQILKHEILIDCSSRQSELIDIMSREVRRLLSANILWINGRKHECTFSGSPVAVDVPTGIDIIPRLQYIMEVESIENFSARETVAKTTSINVDINIQ